MGETETMTESSSLILTKEQQSKLNNKKINIRIENERYLRAHPEISAILRHFVNDVLENQPDNIEEYSSKYFCNPNLKEEVDRSAKMAGQLS